MLGGGLAPAVDRGTALGRGEAGAGLLVAVAPTVGVGALGLLAEVSTFSASLGLRAAACRRDKDHVVALPLQVLVVPFGIYQQFVNVTCNLHNLDQVSKH